MPLVSSNNLETDELYGRLSIAFFYELPFSKLMRLSKMISVVRKKKFKRNRENRYGDSKAMSYDDLAKFFSFFKPEEFKFKVLFLLMAFLGLRLGEAVKVKREHLDLSNKRLMVETEKQGGRVMDSLFLHERVYGLLLDYLDSYESEVIESGYLFSSVRGGRVSTNQARIVFRRVCDRAGLSMVYGEREVLGKSKCPKGRLYLYTPHSLRHSLGMYLSQQGTKIEYIQKILRHKSILNTMVYVKPRQDDVDYAFYKAFKGK